MAKILIKCPSTGDSVPTGVTMDSRSFLSSDLGHNSVQCASCQKFHTWSKADAFLGDVG